MSTLSTLSTLPAPSPEALAKVYIAEERILQQEQAPLRTEHVLHAGLYARTVRMPAGIVGVGALIKRATLLIANGDALAFVGEGWAEITGYNVLPASSGRKQIFVTRGPLELTMIFPTQAKTVAEAEEEFTDETEMLMSRADDSGDTVIITGE